MNVNDITTLIGSLGFPIVASGALFWLNIKTNEMYTKSMEQMRKSIEENSHMIDTLTHTLDHITPNKDKKGE